VPKSTNLRNRTIQRNNSSGVNGVHRAGEKWEAQIKVGERRVCLGIYPTVEEAAQARKAAQVLYGPGLAGVCEGHGATPCSALTVAPMVVPR
jgi:hypothetical protein